MNSPNLIWRLNWLLIYLFLNYISYPSSKYWLFGDFKMHKQTVHKKYYYNHYVIICTADASVRYVLEKIPSNTLSSIFHEYFRSKNLFPWRFELKLKPSRCSVYIPLENNILQLLCKNTPILIQIQHHTLKYF